jgi:aldehyde dehydrogenase (NAD+)
MAPHPFLTGTPLGLLIDGGFVPAADGQTLPSHNPATGEHLADFARGQAADVDRAVAAARAAFESGPWPRFSPAERQALLLRLADLVAAHAEDFALLDTLDMGSPIRHTRGSVAMLTDLLRYYAGMARGIEVTATPSNPAMFACTVKEPVGVCAAIIPWNGPLWASILKLGPVLATGCTLLLKPAEDASLSPLLLGKLALEAGRAAGRVQRGDGSWQRSRRRAGRPSRRGQDRVYRIRHHRPRDHGLGRRQPQADQPGTGRQIAQHRLCRCRSRQGRAHGGGRGLANSGQVCSAGTRLSWSAAWPMISPLPWPIMPARCAWATASIRQRTLARWSPPGSWRA